MAAAKTASAAAATNGSRRRSGRLSSTPKKSKYFEDSEDELADETPIPKKRGRPPKKAALVKQESEEQYEEDADPTTVDEDSDDDDGGRPKKRSKRTSLVKAEDEEEYKDEEDEEEEEEEESEQDESAPMKVKIIPLEKMRDTGGVDYADRKLHKNTMLFLKDLKMNNRRPWLKSNDGEYRRALQDWNTFMEVATTTIIEVDETIPELPVKDVNFRIHRDIRFSKDPTPYKPHFSAAWSRTGRKGPYACYYVHCKPGAAFIGGGLWCPEAAYLRKLRRSIDRHPDQWREMLNDPAFKPVFFPGAKTEEKLIDAFFEKNKGNALKKKPMGYEMTHPDIKLLRLRNFTVGKKVDDGMFCRDDAQEKLTDIIRALYPFVTFLNSVVMPDPGAESDDEESQEEDEGGGSD